MNITTKVVFYILKETATKARQSVACRLTEKAYLSKRKVFLLTTSTMAAEEIDNALWTFRDISFIPHQILGNNIEEMPSVLIGTNEDYLRSSVPLNLEVLINLSNSVPDCHSKFQHLIEIITADEEARALGRKRYAYYQAQGYQLETHQL